jgi:hypothetical protein
MDNTPTSDTESILVRPIEKLSTDNIYMFFVVIVFILTIILLMLTFTKTTTTTFNNKTLPYPLGIKILEWIGMSLFIMSMVTCIMLLYVPSLKSMLQLLDKVRGAIFIFVFLLGLIIFYRNVSETAITNYRFIIVPIIAFISFKLFTNAMTPSTQEEYTPNLQIEKIRVSLVYVAFVIFSIIMYVVDFGGFIKEYFGPTLTATIVLLVMGMIYLITLLSYPIMKLGTDKGSDKGLLSGLTWTGIGHCTFMILTVVLTIIGVASNMSSFTDDSGVLSLKNTRTAQLFGVLITLLVLWIGFFSIRSYQDIQHTLSEVGRSRTEKVKSSFNTLVLLLGGVGLICTLAYWFISISHTFTKTHDITGLVLNLIVIFVVMIILFKYLANTTHFQKSPYFRLAVNSLFYIPCLIYDTTRSIFGLLGIELPSLQTITDNTISGAKGAVSKVEKPAGKDMILLATVIIAYIAYFIVIPYSLNKVAKQGGNVIQQQPISLSEVKSLGTYNKLNGIDENKSIPVIGQAGVYNYTFAISFWLFLESSSTPADNYYTVLNYNELPHIMWNPKKATMIFTTKHNTVNVETETNPTDDITKNGNRVLLTLDSLGMQKWNNIVINYVNGTLDIFVNGQLIQSSNDVVPEMSNGELTTGSTELRGKLCNVVYFNYSLEMKNIHYLYNLVKDTNPPIITDGYFGTTEKVTYEAKASDPTDKWVIPINIETDIIDDVEQGADKVADKLAPTFKPKTKNYLSLAWYFNQNGDEHNSASPEDGVIDDIEIPTLKTPVVGSGQTLPMAPTNSTPPKKFV